MLCSSSYSGADLPRHHCSKSNASIGVVQVIESFCIQRMTEFNVSQTLRLQRSFLCNWHDIHYELLCVLEHISSAFLFVWLLVDFQSSKVHLLDKVACKGCWFDDTNRVLVLEAAFWKLYFLSSLFNFTFRALLAFILKRLCTIRTMYCLSCHTSIMLTTKLGNWRLSECFGPRLYFCWPHLFLNRNTDDVKAAWRHIVRQYLSILHSIHY